MAGPHISKVGMACQVHQHEAVVFALWPNSVVSSHKLIPFQVLSLLLGGGMALSGTITPEQLTTFVLYVEFVTAASLSVCDQWGEALGPVASKTCVRAQKCCNLAMTSCLSP